jgi:hypothetical protein
MQIAAFADLVGLAEPDVRYFISHNLLATKKVPTKAAADPVRVHPTEKDALLAKLVPVATAAQRAVADGVCESAAAFRDGLVKAGSRLFIRRLPGTAAAPAATDGPSSAAAAAPAAAATEELALVKDVEDFLSSLAANRAVPLEQLAARLDLTPDDVAYVLRHAAFATAVETQRPGLQLPKDAKEVPKADADVVVSIVNALLVPLHEFATDKFGGGDIDGDALLEPYAEAGFRVFSRAHEADPSQRTPFVLREEGDTWYVITYGS